MKINTRLIDRILWGTMLLMLTIGCGWLLQNKNVHADTVPFSVKPVQSKLQRDKQENYFDILLKPGHTTKIETELTNKTAHSVVVDVAARSAQTNNNGLVDYTDIQKRDTTLQTDMREILTGPKEITVPAKASVIYSASLAMPSSHKSGLIVGGLIFKPQQQRTTNTKSKQVGVVNQYQYTLMVLARSQNKTWQPKLQFNKPGTKQTYGHTQIYVGLHNVSGTFLNQLQVDSTATNMSNNKRYNGSNSNMQMAPNSHFNFGINLPLNVKSGVYMIHTKAYYVKDKSGNEVDAKGVHYKYMKDNISKVHVSVAQANKLNNNAKNTKGGIPWLIMLIIAIILILVAIILLLLWILLHHRSNDKNNK